jgi:alanine racemase
VLVAEIEAAGLHVACTHAANTAAAIDHPGARLDLVRMRHRVYGLDPSPALAGRVPLEPALSLHARVSHVKRVAAGEGISYGLRYRPAAETTIATVPLGYADGLPGASGPWGAPC